MKQNFQYVTQKEMHNKSSDSFAADFDKHFTQKLSQQQCRNITSFEISLTVNPIGLMKNWGKSACKI